MPSQIDNRLYRRIRGFSGWAAAALVGVGAFLGFATFLLLTGLTPIQPSGKNITYLLIANAVVVAIMVAMIAAQFLHLLWERRRGTAGAGLHVRLVGLFSLVAVVPALLVAAFATVTLSRGLDTWFSTQTRGIVETAASVADAYVTNASEATRNDLANIAGDLVQQQQIQSFNEDRPTFSQRLTRHASLRNLGAIFVVDITSQEVDTSVAASKEIGFLPPSTDIQAQIAKGDPVLIPPARGSNLIRAAMKLQGYPNAYLYIYRLVSPAVIEQLEKTRAAKAQYDQLQNDRFGVQLNFALVYSLLALIFLLAAVWAGMWFSDRLVAPIVRLLNASRDVARGDFNAKVKVIDGPGDLQRLSQTFNLMTDQIAQSRDQLVETNQQLDGRRRFTEAMLEGVSAGIIGIGSDQRITLVNKSALNLLGKADHELMGQSVTNALPEFAAIYHAAQARSVGSADGQIDYKVRGQDLSFIVRITTELGTHADHGHVLTFDDITQLVSAQRNSAWSDIARRIAHEIKNPLTPIQLSAERLKRKYLKEIQSDRQIFEQCTDTIIRQVGDIGRIVDEFSSFARMPSAVPEPNNLNDMVREATVLQRVSASDVDIEFAFGSDQLVFPFDRRLLTQAVTNLVKNAGEAIEARNADAPRGRILISTGLHGDVPFMSVTDNGIGLPEENRNRLAEPYMTTREKGTGLGLAIVKRIMEEHGGFLRLSDAPGGKGAVVTLEFAPQPELVRESA
ncbi:sensor histidine kinase NtrY-like [Aestuariivirga litoralis]|uniref:sensor histidine kinase NtrY-like n=1 Tax=Aestuariivirga litoralis TaxID=2650924 RepID=UPI0018C6E8E4|nr:PAS domain-containing sensor histidine kinase [Aestuariivirga litoralis]MBG1231572.1 PAS domain-containing sensor histidine kinase [Aestuariivirga litoralis]